MVLSWRHGSCCGAEHRLIPHFIDWGTSPHSASTATRATLVAFRAEHPRRGRVQGMLRQLD
jgi:hypothetical protein